MIICTSLSPAHKNKDVQASCLESWKQFGDCITLNASEEAALLKKENYEGIAFYETVRTCEQLYGKKLVSINAFIDTAKMLNTGLLIINSDIHLKTLPKFKEDGITILSRYDYAEKMNECKVFPHGFDVFYIPAHFLGLFPPAIYAMGMAWWDLWIPYRAMRANIPVYFPFGKFAFHKLHKIQYSYEQWAYIGEFFRHEFRFDKSVHINKLPSVIMNQIRQRLIYVK